MENNFYEKGLKFECKRCSYCCGNGPGFVYLSKVDLLNLCRFFKLKSKDFEEKFCRWVEYYEGKTVLALIETKNLNACCGTTDVLHTKDDRYNAEHGHSGTGWLPKNLPGMNAQRTVPE